MRAPDGRGFIRDGVGEQLRQGRKNTDILSRRLDRTGVAAPAETSDSVIGTTIAIPANTVDITGSEGSLSVSSWNFLTDELGGNQPTLTTSGAHDPNSFSVTEDGWYEAHILLSIGWTSGAPDVVFVTAGRALIGLASSQFAYEVPTVLGNNGLHSSSRDGAYVSLFVAKQYHTTAHAFSVQVSWPNTATPVRASGSGAPVTRVDFTRVG